MYYALLELDRVGKECTVESATIKQDVNGEWICEVVVKLVVVNIEGVAYDCAMESRGLFLEFDKSQIEGGSKVEIVIESENVYLPASTQIN